MTNHHLHTKLSRLFRDSAQAHHAAFSATDGEDPVIVRLSRGLGTR